MRLAKATQNEEDGGEQISLLIRSYETVTAVRMIYVDGAQKEQTYTYQNPTDKSERKDVPIDDVDAWTIDGNRLTKDQLMKALQKPTPVFLYDNKDFPDYVTAPFSSILNPKAIVLRVNRERGTPW